MTVKLFETKQDVKPWRAKCEAVRRRCNWVRLKLAPNATCIVLRLGMAIIPKVPDTSTLCTLCIL